MFAKQLCVHNSIQVIRHNDSLRNQTFHGNFYQSYCLNQTPKCKLQLCSEIPLFTEPLNGPWSRFLKLEEYYFVTFEAPMFHSILELSLGKTPSIFKPSIWTNLFLNIYKSNYFISLKYKICLTKNTSLQLSLWYLQHGFLSLFSNRFKSQVQSRKTGCISF